jgi:putative membrane protein
LKTDHTRLISELKAYADKKGIAVPVAETDEDKGDIRNLAEEKEANKFDEEWCKMLKDRHQKSINKFEARLNKSEDIELKNWVVASLPALRNHLEMLQQNEDRLK